jgi:transcriptional regulator with XRE-family HTH domain
MFPPKISELGDRKMNYYDMKKCGDRICQLRTQCGYTQEELARKLHIGQGFLSRIESGQKGCSVDLFVQLSECFQVTLDFLILGSTKEDNERRLQLKANISGLIDQLSQFQKEL